MTNPSRRNVEERVREPRRAVASGDRDPYELGMVVVATIVTAMLLSWHLPQVGDDSFIFVRYARHVLAGDGPVFNRGEPVEGFSSVTWLAWMSLLARLGIDPLHAAQWTGRAFALAMPATMAWAGRRFEFPRGVRRAVIVFSALLWPWTWWAGSGLETTAFGWLVTVAAVDVACEGSLWVPVGVIVTLTRPEGPGIAILLLVAAAWRGERRLFRPAAILLGTTALLVIARWIFYGVPLPNTFYAKADGPWTVQWANGLRYSGITLEIALALALAPRLAGSGSRRHEALAAIAFGTTLLVIAAGGDWMSHRRLLVPVLPLLILLGAGVGVPCDRRGVLRIGVAGAVVIPYVVSPSVLLMALSLRRMSLEAREEGGLVDASLQAAAAIRARRPTGTIAVNHAGALPAALWDRRVIDMVGLTDAHIAREVRGALHAKWDAAYVLAQRPALIVLNERVRPGEGGRFYHPGYWEGETALVEHPEFARHYRPWNGPAFPWRWSALPGVVNWIVVYERIDDER